MKKYLSIALLVLSVSLKLEGQIQTAFCKPLWWISAKDYDVLSELADLSITPFDVDAPCPDGTGNRPIHYALMMSHDYTGDAIEAFIEHANPSFLVVNLAGETPDLLLHRLIAQAQEDYNEIDGPLMAEHQAFMGSTIGESTQKSERLKQSLTEDVSALLDESIESDRMRDILQASWTKHIDDFQREYQESYIRQGQRQFQREHRARYEERRAINQDIDFLKMLHRDIEEYEALEIERRNNERNR